MHQERKDKHPNKKITHYFTLRIGATWSRKRDNARS
jgi:uncharacterized protein (DUF736 family)